MKSEKGSLYGLGVLERRGITRVSEPRLIQRRSLQAPDNLNPQRSGILPQSGSDPSRHQCR